MLECHFLDRQTLPSCLSCTLCCARADLRSLELPCYAVLKGREPPTSTRAIDVGVEDGGTSDSEEKAALKEAMRGGR